MNPKTIGDIKSNLRNSRNWFFSKLTDIKYAVEEWVLKKTSSLRIKYSKKLIIGSHAYFDFTGTYEQCWDDVNVHDQWGFWLPLGFGICSRLVWESDNDFNKEYGYDEEPWLDVHKSKNYWTYYTKDTYLEAKHYFKFARKHLTYMLGDVFQKKELELRLHATDLDFIKEETIRQAEWIKSGKPKLKVEFCDQARENLKDILGEDEAKKLFEENDKRNKEIDEENERKKRGENVDEENP